MARGTQNPRMQGFGRRMQRLRSNADGRTDLTAMSRQEFVQKAMDMGEYIAVGTLSDIEQGYKNDVSVGQSVMFARVLGVPLAEILCDVTQPFEEADLPTFTGMSHLEVLDWCFGTISDGMGSYARLGPVPLLARQLELALEVHADAANLLREYLDSANEPKPQSAEERDSVAQSGEISADEFARRLQSVRDRNEARENWDIVEGFLLEVVPMRESLKQAGVRFGRPTHRFEMLSDARFKTVMQAYRHQHWNDWIHLRTDASPVAGR